MIEKNITISRAIMIAKLKGWVCACDCDNMEEIGRKAHELQRTYVSVVYCPNCNQPKYKWMDTEVIYETRWWEEPREKLDREEEDDQD